MEFKTYVQSAVASFISRGTKSSIFIKHYNTLDITQNDLLEHVEERDNYTILYHEYEMHEMHSSYAPFLQWIQKCYNDFYKDQMTAEEFLRTCGVYPLHVEPLAGFIMNNECTRHDDVLYFEIGYENERIPKDILAILDFVSTEHPLILIISKLHLAPCSTIKLVHSIVANPISIRTILMYNDEFSITDYKKPSWNALMQEAGRQDLQLEWGSLDSERTMDVQDEFWYDKKYVHEYYLKLKNMLYTFSLEDAYYYINNIINRLDEKTIRLDRIDLINFHILAANIDMYYNHLDLALAMCDKLTDMQCHESDDLRLRYEYYYTYASARLFAEQADHVKKCCGKCIETAREMGDDLLECRAKVLLYILESGMGRDLFEYEFKFKCDTEILDLAKHHGFRNFLAYIYVFGFDNDPDSLHDIALGVREPYYLNIAIDLARELDNDNMILIAYMKNIIQYSEAGYHAYVRDLYKKRMEVLGNQNPVREAHMLAGLGYNGVILEEYEQAHSYLIRSIVNLSEIEQPSDAQPGDIMNSMYNLALIHFVAENYQGAASVVEMIFKMLKEMGYYSIRACSNMKLYTFIAISCYYLQEYYNSYFYLSKMEIIAEHMIKVLKDQNDGNWDDDIILYHLVKGMMYNYENNYELCLAEFTELKEYAKKCHGSLFFINPIYYVELSSMYLKQGKYKEAEETIDEGIRFCEEENLPRKKERLVYFKEHKARNTTPISEMEDDLPLEKIMQLTRRVGNQVKLEKREKDIQFLTVLQEAISRENMTVDDLFINTTAVIKNSYNLDKIIILRRSDRNHEVMTEDLDYTIPDEEFDKIFDFFRTYKQAFISNRIDKNFTQFMPIMEYFVDMPAMTIVGIPMMEETGTETVFLGYARVKRRTVNARVMMNIDDLMILKFAFSQFCEMMRRIDSRNVIQRMNQQLEQSAITDHLTGITNRTGFSKQAEIICNQGNMRRNVLLYVDLDNFKYYNDTFGHDIGDLVLVIFANLIKRMTLGTGLAVRYGGDEFIVLLYNKSEQYGVDLAKRIYRELEGGFETEIREKLKEDIHIPDEKKISCSIGIAGFRGGSKEELETALNRADQMLYYVKRHGKSQYKLYDPKDVLE